MNSKYFSGGSESTLLEFFKNQRSRSLFTRFVMICVGLFGFLLMYLYAIYSNQLIISIMQTPIVNPSPQEQVFMVILGNRINGQRLAIANEFPSISKFLGYQNAYSASMVVNLAEQYGANTAQCVQALFYLETGLSINFSDPVFVIPTNEAPTLYNELVYRVMGTNYFIKPVPDAQSSQSNFFGSFVKDALPWANLAFIVFSMIP